MFTFSKAGIPRHLNFLWRQWSALGEYIVVTTIRSTKENIHAHTQEKTQLVAISSSVVKLPYYGKAATPLLAATQKGVALLQNTLQIY